MMFPGSILMGAQARLLPPMVPFAFFLLAITLHPFAWIAFGLSYHSIFDFVGGIGPEIAGVHILTLGVFVATAMGAAVQLIPVAFGVGHKKLIFVKVMLASLLAGLALFLPSLWFQDTDLLPFGAFLLLICFGVFTWVLISLLTQTKALLIARRFVWLAIVSAFILALLGTSLAYDYEYGFWQRHDVIALVHFIWAAFGFMGSLAFGFSFILVPMFAWSPQPEEKKATLCFYAYLGFLLASSLGVWLEIPLITSIGAVAFVVAVGLYLYLMVKALQKGMKKRLGISFVEIKMAWCGLGIGVGVVLASLLFNLDATWGVLIGFVIIVGWLLTFLLGILQRILPFLASMNLSAKGITPRLSELEPPHLIPVHLALHCVGMMLVIVGLGINNPWLFLAGTVSGALGALTFSLFGWDVFRRFKKRLAEVK